MIQHVGVGVGENAQVCEIFGSGKSGLLTGWRVAGEGLMAGSR